MARTAKGTAAKENAARTRKSRGNGFGTLEKRPNGSFIGRWKINGKRYAQLIVDSEGNRVTDRREAEKYLAIITAPFRLGSEAETASHLATKAAGIKAEVAAWYEAQPALAIGNAFEAYRKSLSRPRRAGDNALDGYECFYNTFTEWLKANRPEYTELRQITQADAKAYAVDFLATHSGGTFNKHLIFLRCLWRTLDQDDEAKPENPKSGEPLRAKLTCNPWLKINKQQHEVFSRRELTTEELIRVVASVQGSMRLLFGLGIYTGLRLGDCCLLSWSAIDMVKRFIFTTPHKTKKHGTKVRLPISNTLWEMLNEIPAAERTGYVLPDMAEMYLRDKGAVSKRVQKVFISCGIQTTQDNEREGGKAQIEVGFHSLRHTFVSLCGNAGVSLALVQAMVGHTSPEMTAHYFHSNDTALRDAVDKLPALVDYGAQEAAKSAQEAEASKDTPAPAESAQGANLAAFRAAYEKMTPAERKAATKWLTEFNKNN